MVHDDKKIGTKEIGLEIAAFYLAKAVGNVDNTKSHESATVKSKKNCKNFHKLIDIKRK